MHPRILAFSGTSVSVTTSPVEGSTENGTEGMFINGNSKYKLLLLFLRDSIGVGNVRCQSAMFGNTLK